MAHLDPAHGADRSTEPLAPSLGQEWGSAPGMASPGVGAREREEDDKDGFLDTAMLPGRSARSSGSISSSSIR